MRGHESFCAFVAGSPLAREAAAASLPVVPFACRGEWDVPAALRLRRRVRAANPDLLHAHDAHAIAMALMAGHGIAPVVASRRLGLPPRRNLLSRIKLGSVRRWLAISLPAREGLLRAGVESQGIDVVPSGIPLPPANPLAERAARPMLRALLKIPGDSFTILTAGTLEPAKGQRVFLEATALAGDLSGTRWIVAGVGPDEAFLQRLAVTLGVAERVVFAGQAADLPRAMREVQILVLASFHEGLGTVLLDALAAGVPVVATKVGGIPEVVEDGVQGLLVPAGDARAIAEAVRELYLDRERRLAMGARAEARAREFSLTATVERTLASYRAAIQGARGHDQAESIIFK